MVKESGPLPKFARRMIETPKILDLLDIIAGGNGTGDLRERGIDPITGWKESSFAAQSISADNRFRPIHWHRFIDGVFVPSGGNKAVQLDSGGHVFKGFPVTSGMSRSPIWARAAEAQRPDSTAHERQWIYFIENVARFMPEGRGLMAIASNAGITFDLAALRRFHLDVAPRAFRATVGIADARRWFPKAYPMADVWIFVDGRLKRRPVRLRPDEAPVKTYVELDLDDRFLTFVTTDGGNLCDYDWVVFGDPALEVVNTSDDRESNPNHK